MPDTFAPRYYALPSDAPNGRTFFFRVRFGGYDRWDTSGAWVEVAAKVGRDYYSRAIENGDAVPTTVQEAEHS